METKWLIWSFEHNGWWAPASKGYVEERHNAGRYTFQEAYDIVMNANKHADEPYEAMLPDWI